MYHYRAQIEFTKYCILARYIDKKIIKTFVMTPITDALYKLER